MRPAAFGLDITDTSIELVSLLVSGGKPVLGVCARTEMPTGVMVRGAVSDADKLAQAVGHLLDAALGEKRQRIEAGVSLPETQAYSKVFSLPVNLGRDMAIRAAEEEANQTFLLSSAASLSASAVIAKGKETQDVLHVRADIAAIQSIAEALKTAGVKPLFIEPESLAVGRALLDPADPGPVLIADIGAKTTMMAVYENGLPRFSSNVLVAGNRLSEALEVKMNLTMERAEGLKRRVGFDPTAEGGRTYLVLQQSMAEIIVELNRTFEFYRRRRGKQITRLMLSGGTSLLPNIAEYLSSNLPDISVSIGDPFRGFVFRDAPEAETLKRTAVLYATAVGLALRAGGFRKCPEISLLPERQRQKLSSIIGQAREIGAFLKNMVKRSKPPVEKPKADKPAKHHPKPVLEIPEEAEPKPVSETEPGTAPEPVKAEPTAVESSGPPSEKDAAASGEVGQGASAREGIDDEAEETSGTDDTGKGVGELLHGEGQEGRSGKEFGGSPLPATGSGKLTIESIISGKRLQAEPETHAEPEKEEEKVKEEGAPGKPISVVPLLLVVIILALLTATGVYLLAKKSGFDATGFMSSVRGVVGQFLPAQKGKPAQAPADLGAAAVAEGEVPSSISLTVTVGLVDRESTEAAPYLKTRAAEVEVSAKGDYAATGKGAAATGKAKGKVTIINETSRSYTFVATTRFLTKEGVLFRMDKATPIPASGSVETAVTADQPGPAGDIGPSDFTIPGLSAELQKVIYAKSDKPMTGGSTEAKMVTAEDLAKAKNELFEKLKAEAEEDLRAMTVAGEVILPDLVTSTEVSASAPAAGTLADSFTSQLIERFRVMLFPQSAAEALMREKVKSILPEGEKMEDYDLGDIQYTVEAYETASDLAEVRLDMPLRKL